LPIYEFTSLLIYQFTKKISEKFGKEFSQTFVLFIMKRQNEGLKIRFSQIISQSYSFYSHFKFYIFNLPARRPVLRSSSATEGGSLGAGRSFIVLPPPQFTTSKQVT